MEITSSILGLVKNNNGFFKSPQQASFLISQMNQLEGCIGHTSSGYHSCPLFAEWDRKGITKIIKHTNTKSGRKEVITFERKEEGLLSSSQIKEINTLKRKLKKMEIELNDRIVSFQDGSYNRSGDVNTYTQSMIDLYNKSRIKEQENILRLKAYISQKEQGL